MVSAFISGLSGLGVNPGTLCCVPGQDTYNKLLQCLSPARHVNGYPQT